MLMLQDFMTNSMAEDDVTSESSVADLSRFISRIPASPSMSHIISIGQLLESVITLCEHVHACFQNTLKIGDSRLVNNAMHSLNILSLCREES